MDEKRDSERRYRLFFDMSHDLMALVDEQGLILEVNRRWCQRLGGSENQLLGRNWIDWVALEDQPQVSHVLQEMKSPACEGIGLRLLQQDGGELWVKWDAWSEEEGRERYLLFKDISMQKRFEEELRRVELTDELSGVYNRRYFLNRAFEELLRSVRYRSEISLLLMDVDRLKNINEGYGQYTGDQVIRKVGQICSRTLRNTDLLGRMGGGEFAALLVETDHAGAEIIAGRIRSAISGTDLLLQNGPLPVTVTIGLCSRQPGDSSIDEMLQRAQQALKSGKAAGGDRVVNGPQ